MIGYLAVGTVWDLIKREVPVVYLIIGVIGALIYQIIWREETIILLVFGAITGGIFLLISRFTEQGIGYGDSWVILIMGIYLGIWKLLVALAVAFLGAAVVVGIGVMGKRCRKKSRIPFLPFLMLGYLSTYGW